MRGYRDLIVVLDDPEGFGNKKSVVGGILFDRLADEFVSNSENQGYNIIIGMTVSESTVTGSSEIMTFIKGDKGDDGNDSIIPGPPGADGVVQSIVAGNNITVDNTDPANPIISSIVSGESSIDTISVNSEELPIVNKNVNINIPVNTSELVNDSNFVNQTQLNLKADSSNVYSKSETDQLISNINIPLNTSDLINDSGFITATETEQFITYTGATSNVDLNGKSITNINSLSLTNGETVLWDTDENALSYTLPEDSSLLRHIFFTQVQGTVPFDREVKEYVPVKDNWFLSMVVS